MVSGTGATNEIQDKNADSFDSRVRVYPNPASKRVYVSFSEPEFTKAEVQLYNYNGQLILTRVIDDQSSNFV